METFFKVFFFANSLSYLSVTLGALNDVSSSASCDLKTRCLNDAISCLSGQEICNRSQGSSDQRLRELEKEVANLKAQLAKAGQPGGFATLDNNGRLPQNLLVAGYDKYSAYDLGWQSLHMAAAAACRGSTATGGSGPWANAVMVRNTASKKTCSYLCSQTPYSNCDGEVSIYGRRGKAKSNGERVGYFYNYSCGGKDNGGSEASSADQGIMGGYSTYFSFCCCRK